MQKAYPITTFKKIFRFYAVIPFVFSVTPLLFANNSSASERLSIAQNNGQGEMVMTQLQEEARSYRAQGFQMQQMGDLKGAMGLYQKAIQLDPGFAVPYNDLGIIYEANGEIDRAEQSYLKAVSIDRNYLSAYSNLAVLYENKRDLKKAAYCWKKRADLGPPSDPWTQRAKRRLDDIRLVLGEKPVDSKEQDVVTLMNEVKSEKVLTRRDDKAQARNYFEKAKVSYKRREYVNAYKQALDAQMLDPSNKAIESFIEKLQTRLLSR
jgi:tetratricopeptide (TPR) repeat protein